LTQASTLSLLSPLLEKLLHFLLFNFGSLFGFPDLFDIFDGLGMPTFLGQVSTSMFGHPLQNGDNELSARTKKNER